MSYTDTVHDALYFSGAGYIYVDSITYTPLYRLQDGQWDTLGIFGNAIYTSIVYHDTLIVGGGFHTANGEEIHGVACYANNMWQPYGTFGTEGEAIAIYELRVLDGDLYAVGAFSYADGHLCNSVAKRVGGHWENVGDLSGLTTAPTLLDIAKYNGNLVVTGNNIHNTGEPLKSVMQYDGSTWGPVGEGIQGGVATGLALTVYQGDLYLGGEFFLGAGNAGQSIMRWDGETWHSLGDGIQVYNYSYQYAGSVTAFGQRDGLLLVGGTFYYAGHVPASSIASWDGTNWCSLGGDLDPRVRTMTFFHDTLYVGCGLTADGVPSNGAAKFIGITYQLECSTTGVEELTTPIDGFRIATEGPDAVALLGLTDGPHAVQVWDAQGRLILSTQVQSEAGRSASLHMGTLNEAVYLVRVDQGLTSRFVPVR